MGGPSDFETGPPSAQVFHPAPTRAADAMARGRYRLRILVVSAAPVGDGVPLDLRHEWLQLQQQARAGYLPATLFRLLPPTREALQRALETCADSGVSPHVLHFAGHGKPGYLSFENTLCGESKYHREDLARDLKDQGIRLLVLNACDTATRETVSLARYLQESGAVEAAIGHANPVPDGAAVLFATELYGGLCRGQSVLQAVTMAERAVAAVDPASARAIQLFGGNHLRFTDLSSSKPASPLIFDGTTGRGRMVEVPHFFGRAEDVVALGRFMENSSRRALVVAGVGGIGKTTLVQEVAGRHVWRFPGGTAFASVRSFHFGKPTAEELVRNAAVALLLPDASGPQLVEHLMRHLTQSPGLLVFDNLEALAPEELERLIRVLEQLPLNGSKALLTLRPAPQLLYESPWLEVHVLTQGLSPRAGAGYVVHVGRRRVPAITAATLDGGGAYQDLPLQLTMALSGHPKMIEIAVGIAANHGLSNLQSAVPELEAPERAAGVAWALAAEAIERRMESLLGSSLGLLDDDGLWVLSLLAVFPDGSFTRDELEAAATTGGLDAPDDRAAIDVQRIDAGLSSIIAAGLADRDIDGEVYRIHPTVRTYVRTHAPLDSDAWLRAFYGLLKAALVYVIDRQDDYGALDRRLFHILGLFEAHWTRDDAAGSMRRVVGRAMDAMDSFLRRRGHWTILARWQERLASISDEDAAVRAYRLHQQSLLLEGLGRLNEARALLGESARIHDELGNRQGQSASLHLLARIEEHQGNYAEARRLLRETITMQDEIGRRDGRAASLYVLARIAYRQGNYDEARALLSESTQIVEELGDRLGRAQVLHQLAAIEEDQGNHAKARANLRESIQILNELGDREGQASSLHQLAIIEEGQGNHVEARALLRESIYIGDELGERAGRAASLHQLAIIEEGQGNHVEARALLSESSNIWDELGSRGGRAASLHQLAIIEVKQDHYAEARALLRESIVILDELGDRDGRGASLHVLAIVETNQRNYDAARALLRESIHIRDELGDRSGRASSLHQLAIIDEEQGNYDEARALLRESMHIRDELGDRSGRASSLHQLGLLEHRHGRYDEGRALLRESIRMEDELGDREGRAASLVMLGQMAADQGQTEEGCALVREGIAILEEVGSRQLAKARDLLRSMQGTRTSGGARAMLHRSRDAFSKNRVEEAIGFANTALEQAREARNIQDEASALFLLGEALINGNEPTLAADCFESSLALLEALGSENEAQLARDALTIARTITGDIDPGVPVASVDPGVTIRRALHAFQAGHYAEALTVVHDALPTLSEDAENLIMARAIEARAHFELGHGEESLAVVEQAISEAAARGSRQHVDGLRKLELHIRQANEMKRLAALPVEELERSASSPAEFSYRLVQKAMAVANFKNAVEARLLLAKARAAAESSGSVLALIRVLVNSAEVLGATGDIASARGMLDEAKPLAREHASGVLANIEDIERALTSK
jgi:tetratricopeptide (TPR) repeat protein